MSEVSSILDHAKAFLSKALHGSEAEVQQLIEDSKPLFEAFKTDLLAAVEQLAGQAKVDAKALAAELAPLLAVEVAKLKADIMGQLNLTTSAPLPDVDPGEAPAPAGPADPPAEASA